MRYLITFFIFLSFTFIGCAQIFVNINATGNNSGTSWDDAYTDLRQAMTTASYGNEIWVTQGFYTPDPTNRHASFILTNGVRMYGGFVGNENQLSQRDFESNETILSGEIAQAGIMDNSYTVVLISDADSTTTIDGFTIRDGNAYTPDIWSLGDSSAVNGGGIYVEGKKKSHICKPIIKNCKLLFNSAEEFGGGLYYREIYTAIHLENITFENNLARNGSDIFQYQSSKRKITEVYIKNIYIENYKNRPSINLDLSKCELIDLFIDSLLFNSNQNSSILIQIGEANKQLAGLVFLSNLVVNNSRDSHFSITGHFEGDFKIQKCRYFNTVFSIVIRNLINGNHSINNILLQNSFLFIISDGNRALYLDEIKELNALQGSNILRGNIHVTNSIFDSPLSLKSTSYRGVADTTTDKIIFRNVVFNTKVFDLIQVSSSVHLEFNNCTFKLFSTLLNSILNSNLDINRTNKINFNSCLFSFKTPKNDTFPHCNINNSKISFNQCAFDKSYNFDIVPFIVSGDTLQNVSEYIFKDTLIGSIRFYSNSYEQLPCSRGVDVADSSFSTLDLYDKLRKFGPKVDAGAVETQSKTGSQITKVIPSCGNEGRVFFQQNDDHLTTTSWLNKQGDLVNPDSLVSGPYFMVWSDTLGCSDTVAFEIDEFPDFGIQSIIGSDIKCFGDKSGSLRPRIIGGLRPIIYNWSNGDTSGRLNNLSSGIYTLEIFDANGCYDIVDSIEIKSPDSIEVQNLSLNHPSVNQSDGSITLDISGGWPPLKFLWSNGDTSLNISGLQAGEYTLHVEDNRGCIRDFGPFTLGKTATFNSNIHSCFFNPNPIFSTAHLFCDEVQNISSITIITTLGQASNLSFTRAKSSLSINLEEQSSGTYLLHIGFEKGTSSVVRIVVIK